MLNWLSITSRWIADRQLFINWFATEKLIHLMICVCCTRKLLEAIVFQFSNFFFISILINSSVNLIWTYNYWEKVLCRFRYESLISPLKRLVNQMTNGLSHRLCAVRRLHKSFDVLHWWADQKFYLKLPCHDP